MVALPVFRGDPPVKPLWILNSETGLYVPAWSEDPCTCCEEDAGGIKPVLFTFCNCELREVLLSIDGYTNHTEWNNAGNPAFDQFRRYSEYPTLTCFRPAGTFEDCHMYINGELFSVVVTNECQQSNLNTTYATSDVTGDATNFSATYTLGTLGAAGDRGRLIAYSLREDFSCPGTEAHGTCVSSTPILLSSLEAWNYLVEIVVSGECNPCDGGYQVDYSIAFTKTQVYYKIISTAANSPPDASGPGACTSEGFDIPTLKDGCTAYGLGSGNPDPGDNSRLPAGNWFFMGYGIPNTGSYSGTSACIAPPNCPTPSSGQLTTPGCWLNVDDEDLDLDHDTVEHSVTIA